MMWLRNNISTIIAGTVDSTIFSIFAFMIFTDSPISVEALIFTYVLSTVWLRWVVALFDTPLLYYAGLCVGEDGIE